MTNLNRLLIGLIFALLSGAQLALALEAAPVSMRAYPQAVSAGRHWPRRWHRRHRRRRQRRARPAEANANCRTQCESDYELCKRGISPPHIARCDEHRLECLERCHD